MYEKKITIDKTSQNDSSITNLMLTFGGAVAVVKSWEGLSSSGDSHVGFAGIFRGTDAPINVEICVLQDARQSSSWW